MRISVQRLMGDGEREAPPYLVDVPDTLSDPLGRMGNLLASHFWDDGRQTYYDPGFKLVVEIVPDEGPASFTLAEISADYDLDSEIGYGEGE